MSARVPTGTGRLYSLDLLRAIAALTVFYLSLSLWFRNNGGPTAVTTWLARWVAEPAHLNQDFGFFGVALLFLISGFVLSLVAMRETAPEFALKRVMRIFPVLAVAALFTWLLVINGSHRLPGGRTDVSLSDLLLNSVLASFFVPGRAMLIAVAWTLIIQLAIYAMVWTLLPWYRRAPWLVIGIEIAVCAVVLAVARNFAGLPNATIANIGAFGTAVVLGQVVWAVWARRLPLWAGTGLGLACWLVFLWGDALGYGRHGDSYPLTLFIALLVILIALLGGAQLRPNRVVSWVSSRSYCLYLLHQTVAFTVLATTLSWGRWLAGLLAVGCTFVLVELVYRAVEQPARWLVPVLLGRARRPQEGAHSQSSPPPAVAAPASEPVTSGVRG